jgi:two-component system, chemotaxis family, protein-glutamate methylesterase/glutaminase
MIETAVERLRAHPPTLIGIGASAGALEALALLLPELPPTLGAPVLIVVHLAPTRSSTLAQLLATYCTVRVCEAEDKCLTVPGTVYVAPPDYHLLVESDGSIALSADLPVNFSRPSIDVFFESVAYSFGPRALGILLSGANADGAAGLATLRARGGLTWVQTPATARVAVMPEAALGLAPHAVLDPKAMGQALAAWEHVDA